MPAQPEREKVAVLGGGPAAIAAAFELTATPELRDRFEVTVHQLGWRLGGKCASGRNLEQGGRIEEHGLHVWFGFYDNAFSVMRAAYEELARPAGHPLATLEDAFEGCDELVLYDRQGEGWRGFSLTWPRNDEVPGGDHELPDFWEVAGICCGWAAEQLHALTVERPGAFPAAEHRRRFTPRWFSDVVAALGVGVGVDAARGGEHLLYLAHHLARGRIALREAPRPRPPRRAASARPPRRDPGHHLLAALLTRFRDWMWEHVVREDCYQDPHLRLFFTTFDIFASATAGIVTDGVLQDGWDAINDRELCEWLREHGAKEVTLGATPAQRSPILRSIYDVAFAYPAGVIDDADAAAGTAMNNLLRLLFSYRGSLSYKMQAGMGDTVFTPFYEVLRRRGVKFEFFHAVTDMRLSSDGRLIDAIEIVPQVELKDGAYDPLVSVAGRDSQELECWPSEPRWEQLRDGEQLERRGVNFEHDPNPLGREPVTTPPRQRLPLGRARHSRRRPAADLRQDRRAARARAVRPHAEQREDSPHTGVSALAGEADPRARLGARHELDRGLLRRAARHVVRHDPPAGARGLVAVGRRARDRLLLRRARRSRRRGSGRGGCSCQTQRAGIPRR